MKLSEYMEILRIAILEHDADGQTQASACHDPEVTEEYDRIKAELLSSVRRHHSALELRERGKNEEPHSQKVNKRALQEHLTLVRRDLYRSLKGNLMSEAVERLIGTIATRAQVRLKFEIIEPAPEDVRTIGTETSPSVKPTLTPQRETEEKMEALIAKLKAEGKIL